MRGKFLEVFVVFGLIAWFGLACLVGWVTDQRGRDFALGFWVAAIFSPLIGLLVAIALTDLRASASGTSAKTGAGEGSARAWQLIEGSLDPGPYADFIAAYHGHELAVQAARHKRLLESWSNLDKTIGPAVEAFWVTDIFPALRQHVRQFIADGAAGNSSLAELHQRILEKEAEAQRLEREASARAEEASARAEEERKAAEAKRFEEARRAKERSDKATRRGLIMTGIVVAALLAGWGGVAALDAAAVERRSQAAAAAAAAEVAAEAAAAAAADATLQQQLAIIEAKLGIRAGEAFRDCPDCPELVVVPGRSFMMGSPEGERGRSSDEGPQRRVSVPSLAVGKYEVTWAEWDRCVVALGCASLPAGRFGSGSLPVTDVSWSEAVAYTRWLSKKTSQTYRLLSEAEWEYSARAGSSTPWSFGDGKDLLGDYAWYGSNAGFARHTVGAKMANAFGLHDMHGNASEWVQDCYAVDYSEGQPSDGSAYTSGSCSERVSRGGSVNGDPQDLRSAFRVQAVPTSRYIVLGFRVARTLSSTP